MPTRSATVVIARSRWYANDDGDLEGEIEMHMKVGTVGGSLETNPTVRLSHRLLANPDAAGYDAIAFEVAGESA